MKTLLCLALVLPFTAFGQVRLAPRNPFDPVAPGVPAPPRPGGEKINPAVAASFDAPIGKVGRPIEYSVMIMGAQRVPDLPTPLPIPEGLTVQGDFHTFSLQVQRASQVQISSHRYTLLPTKAGEFTIPAFEVMVDGQKVQVPSATVSVTEAQPGEEIYQKTRAVIDIEDRPAFVGETIVARLLIFDTPDEVPQNILHIAKTSGSVIFRHQLRAARESFMWKGKQYTGIVMPVQLTALSAGEVEVGCQAMVHIQKRDLAGRGLAAYQAPIDTEMTRLKVEALPAVGREPGFTGGIGQFNLSQPELSASEVMVGEPITLKVVLQGSGNIEGISLAPLPANEDWDSYPPTGDLEKNEGDLQGRKTFVCTLVPKREGVKGTPAFPFSYFDPVKRMYVDASIPPVPVNVKPNPNLVKTEAAATPSSGEQVILPAEPPKPALTGLEETTGKWTSTLRPPFQQSWFWILQALPPVLFLGLWLWRRRVEYLAANPQILRRRIARSAARRHLRKARSAAMRGDNKGFLEAGVRALKEAVAPLDSTSPDSLVSEEVIRHFQDDSATRETVTRFFGAVESSHYAPGELSPGMPKSLLPGLEIAIARLSSRL